MKKLNYIVGEIVDSECFTYDIEVDDNHQYELSNNILSHNTVSLLLNNCSSGIEPNFALEYTRKIIGADGVEFFETVETDAWNLYKNSELYNGEIPDFFVTAQDLKPIDHINVQAAVQKWICTAVSKCMASDNSMIIINEEIFYLDELLPDNFEDDCFYEFKKEMKTNTHIGDITSIKSIYSNGIKPIIKITFSDKSNIECTYNHKLFVDGKWVSAINLKINDFIM